MLSEERLAEIRSTALRLHEIRQVTTGGQWKPDGDVTISPEEGVDDIARFGDAQLGIMVGDKSPKSNRDYVVAVQNAGVESMLIDLLEERVVIKKAGGDAGKLAEQSALIAELQEKILELETRPYGEKAAAESENATRPVKKK